MDEIVIIINIKTTILIYFHQQIPIPIHYVSFLVIISLYNNNITFKETSFEFFFIYKIILFFLVLGLSKLNEIITQNNTNSINNSNTNNSNNLLSLQTSGLSNLSTLIINSGGINNLNSDNLTVKK